MRISHVITSLHTGGCERQFVRLLPVWQQLGIESQVIALGEPGPQTEAVEALGIPALHPRTRLGASPAGMPLRVARLLRRFQPDLVLVSAGFDAHTADPLAQLELSTDAYRLLTERVTALADACCGGRVVSLLEGGYDLSALADCVEAHVGALLEAGQGGPA